MSLFPKKVEYPFKHTYCSIQHYLHFKLNPLPKKNYLVYFDGYYIKYDRICQKSQYSCLVLHVVAWVPLHFRHTVTNFSKHFPSGEWVCEGMFQIWQMERANSCVRFRQLHLPWCNVDCVPPLIINNLHGRFQVIKGLGHSIQTLVDTSRMQAKYMRVHETQTSRVKGIDIWSRM